MIYFKRRSVLSEHVAIESTSFVTEEDLWGRNILHIDSIATCSLETDYLFTLHRSMSLYQIMIYLHIYPNDAIFPGAGGM